ncbi:up-regulator of cell proliferation-like isoform X2 [Sardina pilchardus]|uniref:up-regulator of cell proliferation-like isoform X2 n=1 Tax=Sardina pilchardus TaxID=27697 RepID=UPI002E0FD4CD
MVERMTSVEYQDDITTAKERICREVQTASITGNLHRTLQSQDAASSGPPVGNDCKTQSADQSVCMGLHEEGQQSPVPGAMSMKSDQSMNHPNRFADDRTGSLLDRPDSPFSDVTIVQEDDSTVSFDKHLREDGGVLCSVCSKKAFKSCLTCIASFCETHVKQHYTAPALQRHKLVEATGDLEQRLCQQHHRELELFCNSDNTPICVLCVAREHAGHDITEWGENESPRSHQSQMAFQRAHPSPGPIQFTSVNPHSVSLSWGPPEGLTGPQRYRVTWKCDGDQGSVVVSDVRFTAEELIQGEKYEFAVATLMDDGSHSRCVSATTWTEIPKPDNVSATTDPTSLSVTWSKPAGVDEVKYLLSIHSEGECLQTLCLKSLQRCFSGLQKGKEYVISVSTVLKDGGQSNPVTKTIWTTVPVPEQLSVDSVTATSADLRWSLTHVMNDNPHSFLISYHSEGTEPQIISTDSCSAVITGLKPDTEYIVNVYTKLLHGQPSQPSSVTIHTEKKIPPAVPPRHKRDHLMSFLGKLGLLEFYPNKLTLSSLLEINNGSMLDQEVESLKDVPLAFIRKLLMINTKCQNHTSADSSKTSGSGSDDEEKEEEVNPLDLVTALYLCADSFLQQEMSIKMSMCQFAVPFLLPQSDDSQCTLMLWALRSIYKEWRPPDLMHTKNYVEDSVVHAQIPLLSFVCLENCSFSKSQLLNHVLSNTQQSTPYFTRRDICGGNVPKKIANGLVEIAWSLPCGQSKTDVFPEPVAIANMRGDIISNESQFRFLMQVSAAVFVCLDTMTQEEERLLDLQGPLKSKLFLVMNSKKERHNVKSVAESLKLRQSHVLMWKRNVNMPKFCSQITGAIKVVLDECKEASNIEKISHTAQHLGISVDENKSEASQLAKMAAENIMKGIGVCQIPDYKRKQMPLQGKYLRELAEIEVEECRMQNVGDLSPENYKVQLLKKKHTLREQQGNIKTSQAMEQFIQALSTTDKEQKAFFLRWMSLELDRKSRNHLTQLRRKFKESFHGKNNTSITELDQQLLANFLGIEHYMREIGYIYESKRSDDTRHLPSVAAELLLDGYPMELLDGDASIIPEMWVTDVLMEVHRKVGSSRLLVVSVLGVQSTGKSTLLNTMFGVQFPVSSGRCTRGAYMLFLSVGQELREELKYDFVLLIDTEGLKAPELAKLDGSSEHDNQLATLVIGLSDVTIINIAMENSSEMKDVLQIAVHAFLRMKQLGKKPVCHFVHQNVSGLSAHSKLMTDQKHLLEQLDQMTQIAADMENQSEVKEFNDVLDYDVEKNNWYIPGLWHGTPPMAPVNSGYSEAVHEFKKNLIKQNHTEHLSEIPDFLKWMRSLWKAVKHENFIFSFRNSLVAYAYDSLCKEFSEWEWSFRKCIYSWLNNAETQISNTDTRNVMSLSEDLELVGLRIIEDQTAEMNKKLKEYYTRKDRYVSLVERYRAEFLINIKSLKGEITKLVENKLQCAVSLKMDMERVENI